jgi:uncharacterized protein YndB with AHSA1/START domain
MAEHRLSIDIAAPPDHVFGLWMDLDRMAEWVGGVTGVTDVTGPIDVAGTRYTVRFGPMKSPTEILEVEPPHHVRTRFGNVILKGESDVRFDPTPDGTRLTQVFRTRGRISALTSRLFAAGSSKGSFRGELEAFRRIAEREVALPEAPVSREAPRAEPNGKVAAMDGVDTEFPRSLGKVAPRALAAHGLTRYEQLTSVTERELLGIHGVGPKAVRILSEELRSRGLSFRKE